MLARSYLIEEHPNAISCRRYSILEPAIAVGVVVLAYTFAISRQLSDVDRKWLAIRLRRIGASGLAGGSLRAFAEEAGCAGVDVSEPAATVDCDKCVTDALENIRNE